MGGGVPLTRLLGPPSVPRSMSSYRLCWAANGPGRASVASKTTKIPNTHVLDFMISVLLSYLFVFETWAIRKPWETLRMASQRSSGEFIAQSGNLYYNVSPDGLLTAAPGFPLSAAPRCGLEVLPKFWKNY